MDMETIRTYPLEKLAGDIHKEINFNMAECVKNGTVPYVQDNPPPQDMNLANGWHFGDINKILLELHAARIGATSLKWISGADAAMMGLVLKTEENSPEEYADAMGRCQAFSTQPVVACANIRRTQDEPYCPDAKTVYLYDQITRESFENLFNIVRE